MRAHLYLLAGLMILSACTHENVVPETPQQPPPQPRVVTSPAPMPSPTPAPTERVETSATPAPLVDTSKIEVMPNRRSPNFLVVKCRSADGDIDFIAGTENNEINFHGITTNRDGTVTIQKGDVSLPARLVGTSVNYAPSMVRVVIIPLEHDKYAFVWNDRSVKRDGHVDGDQFPFAKTQSSSYSQDPQSYVIQKQMKCNRTEKAD